MMMNHKIISLVFLFLSVVSFVSLQAQDIPKPTKEQVEWADCEIGAIIHFDINVFEPEYEWRKQWDYNPDPKIFNPKKLDTDQWIKSVKDMGGAYAVLVVKHCTGFCLWPTKVHDYSVKSTPWKNGEGDIIAEFIKSCKKYGIKPGLYYSASANGFYKVDNPGTVINHDPEDQEIYNQVVEDQLTELWTQYGDLFEIWFDGGVLPKEKGGPDIVSLLHQYQPNAVVFQGPEETNSLIRWVGNEKGVAPYPCWSTTYMTTASGGDEEIDALHGNPNAPLWCPGEADFPIRAGGWEGGWFWNPENTQYLRSKDDLVERYYTTVGRNTNMLIGVVVDTTGQVPQEDVKRMKEFGEVIKNRFSQPLGSQRGNGNELILSFDQPTAVNQLVLMENIKEGERVRAFTLAVQVDGKWQTLEEGSNIGHKHILTFDTVKADQIKLTVSKTTALPQIREMTAFYIEN